MSLKGLLVGAWNRIFYPAWYHGDYVSQESPIIIGGCARSGTTLLRVILDTHPNIYMGPESRLFTLSPTNKRVNVGFLSETFDVPRDEIDRFIDESGSVSEFIEIFFKNICKSQGKLRWGEKTPKNVLHLDYIFKHFPLAKFIHVIRDGRDVACSLKHFPRRRIENGKIIPLNTDNPLDECIERWVHDVTLGRNWKGHEGYSELKYEDLVFKTEESLLKLFNFLEEPYDERVLNYHEVNSPTRNVLKFPQNIEATKPMYDSSIGRWKDEFTEKDKKMFKRLGGDLLIELGYEENENW
jgi:hypothetical protein